MDEINKEPGKWTILGMPSGSAHCWGMIKEDFRVIKPPYGFGEIVYIKEPHYRYGHWLERGMTKTHRIRYEFEPMNTSIHGDKAIFTDAPNLDRLIILKGIDKGVGWYLRSPLFLPSECARDFQKTLSCVPKRLQDMTEEDAKSEGFNNLDEFINCWDSLNPKYPFSGNFWCWDTEFAPLLNTNLGEVTK